MKFKLLIIIFGIIFICECQQDPIDRYQILGLAIEIFLAFCNVKTQLNFVIALTGDQNEFVDNIRTEVLNRTVFLDAESDEIAEEGSSSFEPTSMRSTSDTSTPSTTVSIILTSTSSTTTTQEITYNSRFST